MPRILLTLAFLAPAFLVVACGDDGNGHAPPGSYEGPDPVPSSTAVPQDAAAPCKDGQESCPCTEPGAVADCKIGPIHFGSLVACIDGVSECGDDMKWSACESKEQHAAENTH